MTDLETPQLGLIYTDADGRFLRITAVILGDRAGREVVGRVGRPGEDLRDYSCTVAVWQRRWRDKEPVAEFKS
jgi:hypothetical protein